MKLFTALSLALLLSISIFAQKKQAEVSVMSTHLRQEPNMTSGKVYTAQRGEKFVVEKKQEKNGWYFVSLVDGSIKGWIRKDTIIWIENTNKTDLFKTTVILIPPVKIPESAKKTIEAAVLPTNSVVENKITAEVEEPEAAEPETVQPAATPVLPATQVAPENTAAVEDSEPIEDTEVLKIETEEVNLKVRVVDGNNRSVGSLDQTHFKVYEDDILQPVTSLVITEVPMVNAIVIDNSRSLRAQLKKVIEAGKIIVGANYENDESTIVRFVGAEKIEVIQDFTVKKSSLNNALDNLFVEGGETAIIDAVFQAAKKVEQYKKTDNKEEIKLRALILVSDGDDRNSTYKVEQLFNLLRDSDVQIYTIGFTGELSQKPEDDSVSRQEKAKSFLSRLAEETGGKAYFPASLDELPKIAKEIAGELRTQYLISYSPTNEIRDGSFRKIKVEVIEGENKEKRTAITRTGRNSTTQP